MLQKVNLLDASLYSQSEHTSHSFRRAELTHPIMADDVVPSRRREQEEGSFSGFPNSIRYRESLSPKRHRRKHQHSQTHYEEFLHNDFLLFSGAVR
jgi:hypothetical protein